MSLAASAQHDAVICADNTFNIGVRCDQTHVLTVEYLPRGPEVAATSPLAQEAERQIKRYLTDPSASTFDLPLAPAGTAFQQRVWAAIAAIPSGHTLQYGDVARTLSSGPRAVGNACGANPYPLVVPCHRVLPAHGGVGGFAKTRDGFLPTVKAWLLRHESASKSPQAAPAKKRRTVPHGV
jgi:methylated-DNA-[protein]-cysteine S-methyltransferase